MTAERLNFIISDYSSMLLSCPSEVKLDEVQESCVARNNGYHSEVDIRKWVQVEVASIITLSQRGKRRRQKDDLTCESIPRREDDLKYAR